LEKILTISQENEKAKDIIIESLKKQEEALLGNKETLKEAIKEIDDRKNEIN
jgi:prefoldin subunit 5